MDPVPISTANVVKRYGVVLVIGSLGIAMLLSPPLVEKPVGMTAFWYSPSGRITGAALAATLLLSGTFPIVRSILFHDAIRFNDDVISVWRPARTVHRRRELLGDETQIVYRRDGAHILIVSSSSTFDVPGAFTQTSPKEVSEAVARWLAAPS